MIKYFPHNELPMDPKERFTQLFQVKQKWTAEELEPYLLYSFLFYFFLILDHQNENPFF